MAPRNITRTRKTSQEHPQQMSPPTRSSKSTGHTPSRGQTAGGHLAWDRAWARWGDRGGDGETCCVSFYPLQLVLLLLFLLALLILILYYSYYYFSSSLSNFEPLLMFLLFCWFFDGFAPKLLLGEGTSPCVVVWILCACILVWIHFVVFPVFVFLLAGSWWSW